MTDVNANADNVPTSTRFLETANPVGSISVDLALSPVLNLSRQTLQGGRRGGGGGEYGPNFPKRGC